MAANVNDARAWEYPTSDPGIIAGTGAESDPIRIGSAQALADLSYCVNSGETFDGKFIVLTEDIVLNETLISSNGNPLSGSKQWTPIGFKNYFSGTFDGRGHTIRGMYIDNNETLYGETLNYIGLFGYTYNATIKNLKLADSYVRGSNKYMGGILGYASGTHLQQNCSYQGKMMTRTNDYVGTMVAYCASTTTIEGCHFEGMIDWEVGSSGTQHIGGVLGYGESATVKNCTVNADIKDVTRTDGQTLHMGGVAGVCYDAENCIMMQKSDGSKNYVSSQSAKSIGGVIGLVKNTVKHCFNYATVAVGGDRGHRIGGVAGAGGKEMSLCGNFGYIDLEQITYDPESTDFSFFAGGVVGLCSNIDGCFNTKGIYATIGNKADVYIGGVIGDITNNRYMSGCFNYGDVRAASDAAYNYGLANSDYGYIKDNNYYLQGTATYAFQGATSGEHMKDNAFFQSYTEEGIIAMMETIWGSGTWGLDPVTLLPIPIECGGKDAYYLLNGKGKGTAAEPYLISNLDDLNTLSNRVAKGYAFKDVYFKQTCDFDFSENAFTPLGTASDGNWKAFCGHYDGDNHTVKNISYTANNWYPIGFFAELGDGAEVKDLKFTDNSLTVSAAGKVGMVAGKATNAVLSGIYVRDCKINQTIGPVMDLITSQIGYNYGAGGLAGTFTGSISHCSVYYTDITGNQIGGLAGLMQEQTTVEDAVVQASLHASTYNVGEKTNYPQCAGGITSRAYNVKVARCVVLPTVDYATYDSWGYIGGLFGVSNSGNAAEYTMCNMNEPESSISRWGYLMGINGSATSLTATNVQIYDKTKYRSSYGDGLTDTDGIKDFVSDLHGWSPIYLNGGAGNLGHMHFSYHYALPQQGIGSYAVTSANGEYSAYTDMTDYKDESWTRPEHLYIDLSYPEVASDNNVLLAEDDIDPLIVERKSNVVSSSGTASKLYLYDGLPVTYPSAITTDKLNYSRNFTNTSWQPLYVPFSMNYSDWTAAGLEIASIKAVNKTDDGSGKQVMVLQVNKVTQGAIAPNTPYLVKAKAIGEKTVELNNVAMAATATADISFGNEDITCTITPTYAALHAFNVDSDASTMDYIMKDGKFGRAASTAELKAQRWYITLSNKTNVNEVNAILLSIDGEGGATKIEDIQTVTASDAADRMYDLQGRRLNTAPQKGVYIINNKKVIK